jgi:hypothetical protein
MYGHIFNSVQILISYNPLDILRGISKLKGLYQC